MLGVTTNGPAFPLKKSSCIRESNRGVGWYRIPPPQCVCNNIRPIFLGNSRTAQFSYRSERVCALDPKECAIPHFQVVISRQPRDPKRGFQRVCCRPHKISNQFFAGWSRFESEAELASKQGRGINESINACAPTHANQHYASSCHGRSHNASSA